MSTQVRIKNHGPAPVTFALTNKGGEVTGEQKAIAPGQIVSADVSSEQELKITEGPPK